MTLGDHCSCGLASGTSRKYAAGTKARNWAVALCTSAATRGAGSGRRRPDRPRIRRPPANRAWSQIPLREDFLRRLVVARAVAATSPTLLDTSLTHACARVRRAWAERFASVGAVGAAVCLLLGQLNQTSVIWARGTMAARGDGSKVDRTPSGTKKKKSDRPVRCKRTVVRMKGMQSRRRLSFGRAQRHPPLRLRATWWAPVHPASTSPYRMPRKASAECREGKPQRIGDALNPKLAR